MEIRDWLITRLYELGVEGKYTGKNADEILEQVRGEFFSTDYPTHQDIGDCCGFFVPKSGSLICNECGMNINEAIIRFKEVSHG
jgi:hypothetical protein